MSESAPTTAATWTHLAADLRRFIRRRVADDATADDLLQETFLRIHRKIKSLEEQDRLAAWVHQIARNVVRDHYRKVSPDVTLTEEPPAADEDPPRLPGRADEWLDELIDQLPEKYRQAVRWAEVEGHSGQEVADRAGLSLSGAKSRIQRGRALLKTALDECCSFHFDRRGNLTACDPKPTRTACRDCDP